MLEEGRTKAERKREGGTLLDELMMSSRELNERGRGGAASTNR